MRGLVLGSLLVLVPATAYAQDMSLAEFLDRSARLEASGSAGPYRNSEDRLSFLPSREYYRLQNQMERSIIAIRSEQRALRRQGRTPQLCLPEHRAAMGAMEMLAGLRAIPEERRGMTIKDAMAEVLRSRYACDV